MTRIYFAGIDPTSYPEAWDWDARPLNILVSFAYIKGWRNRIDKCPWVRPARTMIDSGAFTAYTVGDTVDIDALIDEVNTGGAWLKPDGWDEAVGLDVIGSWEGSKANMDHMRSRGAARAMPVFHIGDPWELLEHYCAHWPKVGLSCLFGEPRRESYRFYEQCFARAWPHRFHSFGWIAEDMLLRFPFDSADSSTWSVGSMYQRIVWRSKGRVVQQQYHFTSSGKAIRDMGAMSAIDVLHRMQCKLEDKWRRELAPLREDERDTQRTGVHPQPPREANQRPDGHP